MDRYGSDGQSAPAPADGAFQPARRRLNITNRLRWSYLISSTLPLMLVGALLITMLLQVQQRNAYASQQALADKIAGNIATFLYDLEQQLLRAARDLDPGAAEDSLASAVLRLANSSPDLRAITVVDLEGRTVATASNELLRNLGVVPLPLDPVLLEGATQVGKGSRTAILAGQEGQPVFQVVLPVRGAGGRLVGALGAEVSAARIRQIFRLGVQGSAKTIYLVDGARQLQLSDSPSDWRPPSNLEALYGEGQTVAEYPGGNGQLVVGARAPVAPVAASSWSVVVEQPSSEFFVEVYRSLALLAALVGLVGLMALAWALYQARRLVLPIRALTAGAQELAGGRLDHRIVVEPGDELGQLASTFNRMAERLQGSLREIERQNEHLRHGLTLARDIQQGLLPTAPPWRTEMLRVCGRSLPASEVGGDFYTYLSLPDGRAAIAIGDISGKGVAAALLMALTSSTLESQVRFLAQPSAVLQAMHDALSHRLQANQMNAALQIAVFDADARAVTLANAGMIAPLLLRCRSNGTGGCQFIDVGGLPIGTRLRGLYRDVTVPLEPGDTLLFLSDGIVEAHNGAGELFGFERLEQLVASLPPDIEVDAIVQRILGAVLSFVGKAEPHDDITIIATRPAPHVVVREEPDDATAQPAGMRDRLGEYHDPAAQGGTAARAAGRGAPYSSALR
ncbi:MAG: SpoIIE family protein phosphatase [Chloroflexi bacterium]|nr:SpoIIE family protein phosphatase [Chloroflexota bacterium]